MTQEPIYPVKQYIGARYVPILADPTEWDNTKTYEPLTIVQHEGNSYTSRQYVPTGIDITNNDYWARTGNYNAQIETYRAQTQNALALAQTNKSDIANIDANLNALHANTVNDATKLYELIQYNAKRNDIVIIGDSITAGLGLDKPNTTAYPELLAQALNMTKHVYAQSGAGFVNASREAPYNTLNSLVTQAITDTTLDKNNVGIVLLMGGINDNYEQATQAAQNAKNDLTLLHANFPNAKIYFGICPTAGKSRQNNKSIYSGIPAASTNIGALSSISLPYVHKIDAWNLLWHNHQMSTDGLHPNLNGHSFLASQILSAMSGQYITTSDPTAANSVLWADGGIRNITSGDNVPDDDRYAWAKTHLNNSRNTYANLIATEKAVIYKSSFSIQINITLDGTQNDIIIIPISKMPTWLQMWRKSDFFTYEPIIQCYSFAQIFTTIGDKSNVQVLAITQYNYKTSCVELVITMSEKPTNGTLTLTLATPEIKIPLVGYNA